jgi:hypothetical protein
LRRHWSSPPCFTLIATRSFLIITSP